MKTESLSCILLFLPCGATSIVSAPVCDGSLVLPLAEAAYNRHTGFSDIHPA